jgi:peptidoglycan/LPS O-acetylase OafA/YrhL
MRNNSTGLLPGNRLVQLDALRGLAALVVVFHHVRHLFISSAPTAALLPFFSGNKAVILFFVLSGYVLGLPYWASRQTSYGKYLVRRFCRIYLPYLGALCLAVLIGSQLMNARLPLNHWFYGTWHMPFTADLVLRQAFFVSHDNFNAAINTAFWSLRYEMEMSLIFPAVCLLLRKLPLIGSIGMAGSMEFVGMGKLPMHIPLEVQMTILWASAFVFGAICSKERLRFLGWYERLNTPCRYLLLYVVVIGYFRGGFATETSNIPAACGVIILAECCRARFWLATPISEYLGKISYSLYLVHGTVLFATFILLYGKAPTWLVIGIYLVTAFGLSHLFWKFIEKPTMDLGKALTKKRVPIKIQTKELQTV